MKRYIFIILLLTGACSSPKTENKVNTIVSKGLPSFQMTTLSGEKLLTQSLPGRTILIFYNPDCDHCQREAEEIRKRLDEFQAYGLYFIAASSAETVTNFATKYDLTGHANVVFATAEVPDVIREMGPMGTPSIFVYSANKELVKNFDGETPVDEIVKVL